MSNLAMHPLLPNIVRDMLREISVLLSIEGVRQCCLKFLTRSDDNNIFFIYALSLYIIQELNFGC